MKNPKQNIAIPSHTHPRIKMFFRPNFVSKQANNGASTNIEIEYPAKINPILDSGSPFLTASCGKNGAIEL